MGGSTLPLERLMMTSSAASPLFSVPLILIVPLKGLALTTSVLSSEATSKKQVAFLIFFLKEHPLNLLLTPICNREGFGRVVALFHL